MNNPNTCLYDVTFCLSWCILTCWSSIISCVRIKIEIIGEIILILLQLTITSIRYYWISYWTEVYFTTSSMIKLKISVTTIMTYLVKFHKWDMRRIIVCIDPFKIRRYSSSPVVALMGLCKPNSQNTQPTNQQPT